MTETTRAVYRPAALPRFAILLVAFSLPALAAGCSLERSAWAEYGESGVRVLQEAATDLDIVERHAEEWGALGASDVVLVDINDDFKLDYGKPTEHYVSTARSGRNATAARFVETVFDVQIADRVQENELARKHLQRLRKRLKDVTNAIAVLDKESEQGASAGDGESGEGGGNGDDATADDGEVASNGDDKKDDDGKAKKREALERQQEELRSKLDAFKNEFAAFEASLSARTDLPLSSDDFKDFQGLLDSVVLAVPESIALKAGASDKVTELLLSFLVHPSRIPPGKLAFLGILQVHCSPGWRTREGYAGVLTIGAEYARERPSRSDPILHELMPFGLLFPDLDTAEASYADCLLWNGVLDRPTILEAIADWKRQASAAQKNRDLQIDFYKVIPGSPDSTGRVRLSPRIDELIKEAKKVKAENGENWEDKLKGIHARGHVVQPSEAVLLTLREAVARGVRTIEEAYALLEHFSAHSMDHVSKDGNLADASKSPENGEIKPADGRGPAPNEAKARGEDIHAPFGLDAWELDRLESRQDEARTKLLSRVEIQSLARRGRPSIEPEFVYSLDANEDNRLPVVVAAFPMVEAQTLDLRNSQRDQVRALLSFASLLEKSGKKTESNAIIDYARRIQTDQASITSLPVVHSRPGGATVGFEFRPAFQAMADPEDRETDAGLRLHPSSFPALFLFICEADEVAMWSHVAFFTDQRWVPLEDRHWFQQAFLDWWWHGRRVAKSYSNHDRLGNARRIRRLLELVDSLQEERRARMTDVYEFRNRVLSLEAAVLGRTLTSRLPLAPPAIAKVSPNTGNLKDLSGQVLTIEGARFTLGNPDRRPLVTLGSVQLDVESASDSFIKARVPKLAADALSGGTLSLVVTNLLGHASSPKPFSVASEPVDATPPTVTAVIPERGWLNAETLLVVKGSNFQSPKGRPWVKSVVVAGRSCPFEAMNKDTLVVTVPRWVPADRDPARVPEPVTGPVVVVGTDGGPVKSPTEITFDRIIEEPAATRTPRLEVTYDGERVATVTIHNVGHPPSAEFLKALRDVLVAAGMKTGEVRVHFSDD